MGVSWIYRLTKEELIREIIYQGICARKVTDLRQFLVKFARANPALFMNRQEDPAGYDEEADKKADQDTYQDEVAIAWETPIVHDDDELWLLLSSSATVKASTSSAGDGDDNHDEDDDSSAGVVPADIADRMAKWDCRFDGTNLRRFLASVKAAQLVDDVTDEELMRGLPLLLRGSGVRAWYRGRKASKGAFRTWEELRDEMRDAFPFEPNGHGSGTRRASSDDSSESSPSVVGRGRRAERPTPPPPPPAERRKRPSMTAAAAAAAVRRNSRNGSHAEGGRASLERLVMAKRAVIMLKRLRDKPTRGTKSPSPVGSDAPSTATGSEREKSQRALRLSSTPPPSSPASSRRSSIAVAKTADDSSDVQVPTGKRAYRTSSGKGQQRTNHLDAKRGRVKKIGEPKKINTSRRIAVNGSA